MSDFAINGTPTRSANSPASTSAEDALPAKQGRSYLLVQNVDASGGAVLWVDVDQDAVAGSPSIRLDPGASLEFSAKGTGFVPSGRVSVISSVAAAYTAWDY